MGLSFVRVCKFVVNLSKHTGIMDFHVSSTLNLINLGSVTLLLQKVCWQSTRPTHILYVDLHSAEKIGSCSNDTSFPGLVLNIKKQIECVDHFGIRNRGCDWKGRSIIRALQEKTGASISVAPPIVNCDEPLVTIISMEDVESTYSLAQRVVVLEKTRTVYVGAEKGLDTGSNKSSSITARLLIQPNQIGCMLGKRGVIISEMGKVTGAVIRILRDDQVPKCATEDDEIVEAIL